MKISKKDKGKHTGIICDKDFTYAHCMEGSHYHQDNNFKGNVMVYVSSNFLPTLIHRSLTEKKGIQLDMESILENRVWIEEIR